MEILKAFVVLLLLCTVVNAVGCWNAAARVPGFEPDFEERVSTITQTVYPDNPLIVEIVAEKDMGIDRLTLYVAEESRVVEVTVDKLNKSEVKGFLGAVHYYLNISADGNPLSIKTMYLSPVKAMGVYQKDGAGKWYDTKTRVLQGEVVIGLLIKEPDQQEPLPTDNTNTSNSNKTNGSALDLGLIIMALFIVVLAASLITIEILGARK